MANREPHHTRRRFFREGLARVIGPVADYVQPHVSAAPRYLRPPGAVDEASFPDTCRRCGKCVEICPADAIIPLRGMGDRLDGTPAVFASRSACVICDGLQCTHVCPSGALVPLFAPAEIDMGLAVVDDDTCVRSHGQPCTTCVDVCPIGTVAIRFEDNGPPVVIADGCTGCGVCQMHCPTHPQAIVIEPS